MKTKFFPVELLENLPNDPLDALSALCVEFITFDGATSGKAVEFHEDYLEAYSILNSYAQFKGLDYVDRINPTSPIPHQNITEIRGCFAQADAEVGKRMRIRHAQEHFSQTKSHYSAIFSGLAVYEFPQADHERIQVLINELRDLIAESEVLTEQHRARLLRRLEAMQRELHKKTSDIDRFWGFIGEAGVNARKFGDDLKPITDRVRELGVIVVAVIFAKEGIPLPPESLKLLLPEK